jgi:cytosolic nonspecific dipeptidase
MHSHIDANKAKYIETLTEAVAIKSVSAWPQARPECQRMMDWAEKKMQALGIKTEQIDIG